MANGLWPSLCPAPMPQGVSYVHHSNLYIRSTLRFRSGAKRRPRQGGVPKSAAEDSLEPGIIHLASLQRGNSSFARGATTSLHRRLPWVPILLYPTASERGEGMLAMLFWVLAALAVVGALAIVWGLYLLVRRWL
jgi:hypothetical protein